MATKPERPDLDAAEIKDERTVYDEPSAQYPALTAFKLDAKTRNRIHATVGEMTTLDEDIRELKSRYAALEKRLADLKEEAGLDGKWSFWNGVPVTMYKGSSTNLSTDMLVANGVSAKVIQMCKVTKPHDKYTVKFVRPKS